MFDVIQLRKMYSRQFGADLGTQPFPCVHVPCPAAKGVVVCWLVIRAIVVQAERERKMVQLSKVVWCRRGHTVLDLPPIIGRANRG